MLTAQQLKPLQRDALREALWSPTHSLIRGPGGFVAAPPRGGYKIGSPKRFTLRLVRMLDRDYLADLDDHQFPTRATLTRVGRELAEQLVADDRAKAGAA